MKGNVCKICTWNCKQNVKKCPFFTEREDISVMRFNREDGTVEWLSRVNTMGEVRPAPDNRMTSGSSRFHLYNYRRRQEILREEIEEGTIRRGELHINPRDEVIIATQHPERSHYRESTPDNEGRSHPIATFLGLDVVVSRAVQENRIIIVTPNGQEHSYDWRPPMSLVDIVQYGINHIRHHTDRDPRDPVVNIDLRNATRVEAMRDLRGLIEEGSITIPRNATIEIGGQTFSPETIVVPRGADFIGITEGDVRNFERTTLQGVAGSQEPLNIGLSDNDTEVHSNV